LLDQDKVQDRVHVFERSFIGIQDLDPKTDHKLEDFINVENGMIAQDSVNRLRDLRRRLREAPHLEEHTTLYPLLEWKAWHPPLAVGGIDPFCPQHAKYLRNFLDDFCGRLLGSLDQAEAKLAFEAEPFADECRLHLWFAKVRAVKYADTPSSKEALRQVREYLNRPSGGKPLVVYGPSGSGKTYVMAKAVAEEAERVSTPSPTGSRERGRI